MPIPRTISSRTAALVRAWLVCLLVAVTSFAHAQNSSPGDSEAYRETVKLAAEEFNLGNYEEALALFEKAHSLGPSARTLRGMGLAEFELRKYPEAVDHLQRALNTNEKALSGQIRESTEALLSRAYEYIGRAQLKVEPASVSVSVDGQPLERTDKELVLSVGDHVIEFAALGHVTQRRTLHVVGRSSEKVVVQLQPLTDDSASAGERKTGSKPVYKRWWLWTSIGVVVAGAVVATVLLTHRDPKRTEFYETPGTPTGVGIKVP